MARSVATIGVSVTARTDKFAKGMKRASRSVTVFGVKVNRSTANMAKLATGFAGVTAGAASVGYGLLRLMRSVEDFNRAMHNSMAIMGDLSETMQKDMRQAAFAVARETRFSATEAAKAYFFLASAGLSAAESVKSLPLVARFAQAGMFDMARATELLTDAQSALGMRFESTLLNMQALKRVSDVLVRANTLANASVQQFSEALTHKAGPALKILNKDIEEGVAALAAFADQGIKGTEAGTALNIVLRDLTTKSIRNKRAFEDFNITVFDSERNMRNIADVIGDIERAMAGMSDEAKKAMLLQLGFTDKSIIFIQTLIGMSEAMRAYELATRAANDATEEVAGKQLTKLQEGWAQLSGTIAETGSRMEEFGTVTGWVMKDLAKSWDIWPNLLWNWRLAAEQLIFGETTLQMMNDAAQRNIDLDRKLAESELRKVEREKKLAAQAAIRREEELAATEAARESAKEQETKAKKVTAIVAGLDEQLKRFGETSAETAMRQAMALGAGLPELARMVDAARELHALDKTRARESAVERMDEQLRRFGETSAETAVRQAMGLGVWGDELVRMMDMTRQLQALEEKRGDESMLDRITSGLERQRDAMASTARELDLLEAGWYGADEAQLKYISTLHDQMDAAKELAKAERDADKEARRRDRLVGGAREISLAREFIPGLSAKPGQTQEVHDRGTDRVVEELQALRREVMGGIPSVVGA